MRAYLLPIMFCLASVAVPTMLFAGTVTTSVTCGFTGQPIISAASSCSIEPEIGQGPPTTASSSAGYSISGNILDIWFSQSLHATEAGSTVSPYDVQEGYVTADGSVSVSIRLSGNGTGLVFPSFSSLPLGVGYGDSGSIIEFQGGLSGSCDDFTVATVCFPGPAYPGFPGYPIQLGSVLDITANEHSWATNYESPADLTDPISGTTDIRFSFVDANANPVSISDVPEPASAQLAGAFLAGLLAFRFRRVMGTRHRAAGQC